MSAIYESPGILSEYLLFHYGAPSEILSEDVSWPAGMTEALDFAVRTPGHFSDASSGRGLDLGCAVGRSSYEMSRSCDEVLGIDFSHSFIAAANHLRSGKSLFYPRRDEGRLETRLEAKVPVGCRPENVSFQQGDAMDLSADLGSFDRVHAANLLCRLPEPFKLLDRLPSLVKPGGELVLATPCTWLEEFTPPENWPKGTTLEWLKENLMEAFELVTETDEPFLIRETARKFQWTRSMLTVWKRLVE